MSARCRWCGHGQSTHDRQYGCSECECERFQLEPTMETEQEPMPRADVAPLLAVGFDGNQCLLAEEWAQEYANTHTRTKLERIAIKIGHRGWEEEAEVIRAAARDTDQALTLLAMLHGRVCHMMAHLGMTGEIDTRHHTVDKLGDALDDVNEFVFRVLHDDGCQTP